MYFIGGHVMRYFSYESIWLSVCNPLSLLGSGSVNTFPANTHNDTRIVLRVGFYAVRVVSKESR
jgi:hypothetical protein